MKPTLSLSLSLSLALALALPLTASAQSVRYRRPYSQTYRLNYGYDHDGGAGGCVDYACSGTCYDGHSGSDLGTPLGTPVVAAADGTVTGTNDGCASYGGLGNTCGGRCGNYVRIRHDDGSTSLYCHMQLGSIRVGYGQHVSCGEAIGSSASSGNSTGPHLHFGHTSPGAGSSSDPWAGGCSRGTSLWVDQGAYRGPPSTACSGPSCSPSGESCNGRDDDCDGRTDEDLRRGCGTDVGECVSGVSTCSGGSWGGCAGEVAPRGEDCNGRDDDCDGGTDESLMRRCGTDVGECVSGIETCVATRWGACVGAVDPVPERCDRLDDDCDGTTDEERICEREEVAWGAPVYGTSAGASTDVDGDGRADACGALTSGFACFVSTEHGFGRTLSGGGALAADLAHAGSIRMGDVDGDGRDDVCALEGDRVVCRRSTGSAFDASFAGPTAEAATSLDLVDVDGDGRVDVCVRGAAGLSCHLADGRGFDRVALLPALSDAGGFGDIAHWGSIRFGDIDGDGRADVCARDAAGLDCWHSQGDRFGDRVRGPRWSDASGFVALAHWSTLRLADVDGDGRDDACIRAPGGFVCARSLGRSLGELIAGPPMTGDAWDRPDGYATIRMGDVDGDGRADVCARENERLRCWVSTGRALERVIEGPPMRDADGFTDASVRYRSIRLADIDGDGRADACARYADGLRCAVSTGNGFERVWLVPAWSDASEMTDDARSASIRIGGIGHGTGGSRRLVGVMACRASPARGASRVTWVLVAALVAARLRRRRRRADLVGEPLEATLTGS